MAAPVVQKLSKKDFVPEQEVRWCPGCGDYAILNAVQMVMPQLGIPREKFAVISGIGCSSRFPYYMNTYGFHGIHGRALAVASGVKISDPKLSVWVATGDGDALAIGGNHFIHTMRRNIDIKVLMFDNRIYGLTKGQYSPTSYLGQVNKTAPMGTVERPMNPISLALSAGATFVARSAAIYPKHLQDVLLRAAKHRGTAFVHIFQNCPIFNDGAHNAVTDKEVRDERNLYLEHGKPLRFGKNREFGIRVLGMKAEVVRIGEDGVEEKDLAVHDEKSPGMSWALLLSQLDAPEFPVMMGVFRQSECPTYEDGVYGQIAEARKKKGEPDIGKLLKSGETWEVK